MSEADSQNKESGLPESTEPVDSNAAASTDSTSAQVVSTSEGDWQTINLPGSVSVDAIPLDAEPCTATLASGTINAGDPEISNTSATTPNVTVEASNVAITEAEPAEVAIAQIKQLREENAELRDRLAQLEQDLVQGQIQWQLETAVSTHHTNVETTAADMVLIQQELAAAQERIGYLFQELELSHQAAQRQQILVETLNEQLESSQERIAHLERDCTLTQQRYNEQVQQVLQAENTCRDLRMRLHRQQQHTLQFKAALEKCLEMPAPYGQSHFVPNFDSDSNAATALPTGNGLPRVLPPKNQPVKPWSAQIAPSAFDPTYADSAVIPEPLSRLLHDDVDNQSPVDHFSSSGSLDQIDPSAVPGFTSHLHLEESQDLADLIELVFPDAQTYPVADQDYEAVVNQSQAIFDLSPFTDSETLELAAPSPEEEQVNQSSNPFQTDESLLQMLNSVPLDSTGVPSLDLPNHSQKAQAEVPADSQANVEATDAPLWNDLAKLIHPSSIDPLVRASDSETLVVDANPVAMHDRLGSGESEQVSGADNSVTHYSANPLQANLADEEAEAKPAVEAAVIPVRKRLEPLNWGFQSPRSSAQGNSRPAKTQPTTPASPSLVTASLHKQPPVTSTVAVGMGELPTNSPSPIVYPLRSSKKLASLAAVELPTFPRPVRG